MIITSNNAETSNKGFKNFKENVSTQVSEMDVKISILAGTNNVRFYDAKL